MGCGASNNFQQDDLVALNRDTGLPQSLRLNQIDSSALVTSSNQVQMLRRNIIGQAGHRECGSSSQNEAGADSTRSLEQKIQSFLSIPDEDAKKALLLASRHPSLHDEFIHLVNIMHDIIKNDLLQFVQQLHAITGPRQQTVKELIDFLTLIGGAKVTVEIYAKQLKSMNITHLTDELVNDEVDEEHETAMYIIQMTRDFWESATDSSLEFAGRLVEAKLIPYLAEDLKNLEKDFKANSRVFNESLTVLHNCARNRQMKHHFRDNSTIQLLAPFLAREEKGPILANDLFAYSSVEPTGDSMIDFVVLTVIKLLALLTLSYIIDEEDNHLLFADASDFDHLLEALSLAWEDEAHRDPHGYNLEELLQGLGNLAQNDDNKKLLMRKGVLAYLKPILEAGTDVEKQEAAHIVWKLAFDKENRSLMEKDRELLDQLEQLKNSSHKGVAKPCSGALWVLNMDKKVQKELEHPEEIFGAISHHPKGGLPLPLPPPGLAPPPPVAPPLPGPEKGHIMISYQWDNQKTLLKIRDSLRGRGFRVWMDVDNISGSTLQAMAEGVEKAEAVLICMSQRYKDSPNCRTEAEYAFALQKPVVPLLMERNYKADGWLGILKGSKLFFDFSDKYPYEKKFEELVKELGQRGRNGFSEVDGPVMAEKTHPVASVPNIKVNAWPQKDVHNWLDKHQLGGCPILQSLTGENLKFLQKLSQRAPEFFFTYLKQDLELSLNDMMHFSDAIDKLP